MWIILAALLAVLILLAWDPLKLFRQPSTSLGKVIAWIRDKIVDDWRLIARKWSFRFNSVGLAILSWIQIDPQSVLYVWGLMPDAVADLIPISALRIIGLVLFGLGILSTLVKQKKLDEARDAK